MKCISISGPAGHGKDTLAKKLKTILEDKGKKVFILHYADYLKMVATEVYNWNGIKDEVGRDILQKLGDKMRSQDKMFLINELVKILNLVKDDFDIAIIPDARFPKEIECLKDIGKTLSIHITRIDYTNNLTKEQNNHSTERALDDYSYDYNIATYTDKEIPEIQVIIKDILQA
ncbi:MAG: hypothetical protein HUJ77_03170 [Clostridium sp.]|uniref:deoxynucleotide monophosphate kinase family protein n=1 Tax=Clostridium sp. TaxID=1506 RepID=UPI0025BBBB5A|nr:hypothetical protein [Clostridium sp.]MCF0147378.1 hypothetical protein [Clostridium sp.]